MKSEKSLRVDPEALFNSAITVRIHPLEGLSPGTAHPSRFDFSSPILYVILCAQLRLPDLS